jgi:hypothetical protein
MMPANNLTNRAAISLGIVVLQFFVVVFWSISLRHNINLNAALLLDCGQKIYNGGLPYVDFYEFNPPVIMYFSVIPAWFSSVSGLALCLSFQIFVSLCIAISGISLFFILKATGFNTEQTLQLISVSMIFHSTTLFFDIFGEREHLMVIGLTPFLIRSPKDHWFRVYGCPEDMPINRCLLRSPKDQWFRVYGCLEDMPINR